MVLYSTKFSRVFRIPITSGFIGLYLNQFSQISPFTQMHFIGTNNFVKFEVEYSYTTEFQSQLK